MTNTKADLSWNAFLHAQAKQPYYESLQQYVASQRSLHKVFPPEKDVFNAFHAAPFSQTKVVILGQDPYHGLHQAHGLSFSVLREQKIPPSLRNIFKELSSDIDGFVPPVSGDLSAWAKQGVLLLNTVLTVNESKAHSHKGQGWEIFTNAAIEHVSNNLCDVVFMLWGKPAQQKAKLINANKHHLLESAHPSPLSAHRGFLGCKHFSKANELLLSKGKQPINWLL